MGLAVTSVVPEDLPGSMPDVQDPAQGELRDTLTITEQAEIKEPRQREKSQTEAGEK